MFTNIKTSPIFYLNGGGVVLDPPLDLKSLKVFKSFRILIPDMERMNMRKGEDEGK